MRRTQVWFVAQGATLHLLTFARPNGTGTHWYRNLRARRSARMNAGGRCWAVEWLDISDREEATQAILRLFEAKYGTAAVREWYEGTPLLPLRLRIVGRCDSAGQISNKVS